MADAHAERIGAIVAEFFQSSAAHAGHHAHRDDHVLGVGDERDLARLLEQPQHVPIADEDPGQVGEAAAAELIEDVQRNARLRGGPWNEPERQARFDAHRHAVHRGGSSLLEVLNKNYMRKICAL